MKSRVLRHAWLVTLCLLAGTASAQSHPEPPLRPWERGVSSEHRRLAETLFFQGVQLHKQLLRDQAMTRYEEALSHWENPDIRWNLALLMKDMGQYLRAWAHLEAALAWGPEVFDERDRESFLVMRQTLLQQHLAVVETRCDEPGAEVALDGKAWFRGPGEARQVVLPGEHVLTVTKPGYFPATKTIVLPVGTQAVVTLSMSVDGVVEQRRWQPWKPWVVFGAGVIAGMAGAGLDWHANRQLDQARRELLDRCDSMTCTPGTPSLHGRALWENRIGTGVMAVGGTVAAAGLMLVFFNQPRSYRTKNQDKGTFDLMPVASPDTAGVSARFRF